MELKRHVEFLKLLQILTVKYQNTQI